MNHQIHIPVREKPITLKANYNYFLNYIPSHLIVTSIIIINIMLIICFIIAVNYLKIILVIKTSNICDNNLCHIFCIFQN